MAKKVQFLIMQNYSIVENRFGEIGEDYPQVERDREWRGWGGLRPVNGDGL